MRYLRFVLAALALGVLVVACTPTSDSTAPTVTLTAPADGTEVTAGDTVTIEGTAADNVGVTRVEVTIGEDDVRVAVGATTWSLAWTPNTAGDYTISAQSFDAAGNASAATSAVTVTVEGAATTGGVVGVITRTAPVVPPPAGPDSVFGGNIDVSVNSEGFAQAGTLAPVVPGEVFVVFKQGRPKPVFGATGGEAVTVGEFTFANNGDFSFQGTAFEQARAYPMGTGLALYRADVASEAATRDLVNTLRAQDLVQEAFPNWILSANQLYPDDPGYDSQAWHYEQLNLPEAWEIENGSSNRVTVAILDTGRYDHPDIAWAEPGANFVGWACEEELGVVTCAPDAAEGPITNEFTNVGGSPHGTHVGGTVGALTDNEFGVAGVNWNVDLLPVKVLGQTGSGSFNGIIEGMFWAAGTPDDFYEGHDNENPARVMNLSLGGNISEACPAIIDFYLSMFAQFGTYTVVSAGNDASPSDVYFPANCPSVITVGATGPTGERSYYSSYGAYVDVMAPGGDFDYAHPVLGAPTPAGVLSTSRDTATDVPNYSYMQGTSMAAPHVTGVVSLMLAADPTLSLDEVRERLHNASVPLTFAQCNVPGVGFDGQNVCGAGLLDAAAALLGATVTTPTATAYAIRYEGEDAPAIGVGNLSSLELFASNVAVATANLAGDYEFEFTDLEPGNYLLVGLEQRAPETGVSNIDRVGFVEAVEIVAGDNELVTIVVNSIYSSLR